MKWLLFLLLGVSCESVAAETIWIDTDPSIGLPFREVDDAYALLLACRSPHLHIAGISTTYGNASLASTTRIATELARRFGASSSISPGAGSAFDLGRETAASIALAARLEKQKLTYVALGPLTNLATLLQLHPHLGSRIERVIFVGGKSPEATLGFGPKDSFRIHDANVVKDPGAVDLVLKSKLPILLAPIETSSRLLLRTGEFERIRASSPAGDFLFRNSRGWFWFWTHIARAEGAPLFDPLAILCVTRPAVVVIETRHASLTSSGELIAARAMAPGSRNVEFASALRGEARATVTRRIVRPLDAMRR